MLRPIIQAQHCLTQTACFSEMTSLFQNHALTLIKMQPGLSSSDGISAMSGGKRQENFLRGMSGENVSGWFIWGKFSGGGVIFHGTNVRECSEREMSEKMSGVKTVRSGCSDHRVGLQNCSGYAYDFPFNIQQTQRASDRLYTISSDT